jgi:hypothetical protein
MGGIQKRKKVAKSSHFFSGVSAMALSSCKVAPGVCAEDRESFTNLQKYFMLPGIDFS